MSPSTVNQTSERLSAVGYVRVSTLEQADSGAGLEAQRRAITQAADHRGWDLVGVFEDAGVSGKSMKRPGLLEALDAVETGRAGVLVVSKLDRLSRSLIDFAGMMERSRSKGWKLAALDLGVDTSTPQGEMIASVMATFAQFERRLIGMRTAEALAVKKAQGVTLGRPRRVPDEVVDHARALRSAGHSFRSIAARLTEEGFATGQGGRWQGETVRQLLGRDRAEGR